MIQYSPIIADTIPGFVINDENIATVTIPYKHNMAIAEVQVKGYQLNYKIYNSIDAFETVTSDIKEYSKNSVTFKIPATKNQYYKMQIAYILQDGKTSAFSSVAIGYCVGAVTDFTSEIAGLQDGALNSNINNYVATFTSPLTEPAYSYHFELVSGNEVIQDSGVVLHNASTDTISDDKIRTCHHSFKIQQDLEIDNVYTLTYTITTINGYVLAKSYKIIKEVVQFPTNYKGQLFASQTEDMTAYENGYVKLWLDPDSTPVEGLYTLERQDEDGIWHELVKFEMRNDSHIPLFTWTDKTVEHGKTYVYCVRQVYAGVSSERILAVPITVGFDHMYLSDGERQLKIAYNPKVSSIKNTILESKMDTIGGQYPFFFRNNNVKYKEFPISGLISYLTDENELFMPAVIEQSTTNLTNDNFAAERKFKLEVLEWLTNGQPKLFRSPAEGNYIVRLLNTSLSPNDTVGRMLHTFSSTAYETAAADFDTVMSLGLGTFEVINDVQQPTLFINLTPDTTKTVFEYNNIRDVKWVARIPSATSGKLTLYSGETEKTYYNVTGTFTTGPDDVYTKLEVDSNMCNNGDSISFKYDSNQQIMVRSGRYYRVLFSIDSTENWDLATWLNGLNENTKVNIQQLIVVPNLGATGTIQIDDMNISCAHGQTLRYKGDEFSTVKKFAGDNLTCYVYAIVTELDSGFFTLGISLLGTGVLA